MTQGPTSPEVQLPHLVRYLCVWANSPCFSSSGFSPTAHLHTTVSHSLALSYWPISPSLSPPSSHPISASLPSTFLHL